MPRLFDQCIGAALQLADIAKKSARSEAFEKQESNWLDIVY